MYPLDPPHVNEAKDNRQELKINAEKLLELPSGEDLLCLLNYALI